MTQVRLSIELEVSQETISAYEKGKYYPSFQTLVKLSELFHTSIDYIMGLSDQKYPTQSITEQDKLVLSLYKRLNPVKQQKVLAYMQGLQDAD